jgi:hypothetical protein
VQNGLPEQHLQQAEPATNPVAGSASDALGCDEVRPVSASFLQAFRQANPDLARVVEVWDSLPLHIRTSILALVDATAPRLEGGAR